MYRFLAICEIIPALNKGRSTYPGNTHQNTTSSVALRLRSTKAGVHTPATRLYRSGRKSQSPPLNKGRSTYPGNTRTYCSSDSALTIAQQRPEHKPRQHSIHSLNSCRRVVRSTKAGVHTPATPLIIILARKLNSQAGLSWIFDYKTQNDPANSRFKDEIP